MIPVRNTSYFTASQEHHFLDTGNPANFTTCSFCVLAIHFVHVHTCLFMFTVRSMEAITIHFFFGTLFFFFRIDHRDTGKQFTRGLYVSHFYPVRNGPLCWLDCQRDVWLESKTAARWALPTDDDKFQLHQLRADIAYSESVVLKRTPRK